MTVKFYDENAEEDEDGEKPDLGVQETRRILGPNSYNDNWDLVRYISELRDDKDRFFAFVDFHGDEGKIIYCPHCSEYGLQHKLGAKMLKQGEKPGADHDQFMSCYQCGYTFGIPQLFEESDLKVNLETTDNPFEGHESIFLSTETRKQQRTRGKKRKGRFSNKYDDPDSDIQRKIDRHGADNVRIIK